MKGLLKRLIPARIRLWRYELYERARYYPELLFSLGSRIECPFCGWRFRRLRSQGFAYPALIQNRVVGAIPRPNVVCPRCLSHDRERLLYLFIKNQTRLLAEGGRLLHVAPEQRMRQVLLQSGRVRYCSTDLCEPGVMVSADLLTLPFRAGCFDAVLCNHVLEHVDDDRQAMREVHRVLRPGGWAILQVPIALALKQTIEDPRVKDESERIRLFGQRDHVRLYAAHDYLERLRHAGFDVSAVPYPKLLGPEVVARHALEAEETVFWCCKPQQADEGT